MDKYAVFLDIDNTLFCGGKIPPQNIEALEKASKAGHCVFLNTARSYGMIPRQCLDLPLDGVVAGIGTDLRLHGEQIFHSAMDKEKLKEIARHYEGTGIEVGFEGETRVLWMYPQRDDAHAVLTSADEFDTIYKDDRISKLYVRGGLSDEEKELFGKDNTLFCHESYSEFVPKGFGKAKGMLMMAQKIGVPRERLIAMGDSSNDADMLLAAGIPVAMGNAIDEIKEICVFITCDASQGGVAEGLRRFLPGLD